MNKTTWYIILIILFSLTVYSFLGPKAANPAETDISQVVSQVKNSEVEKIVVEGDKLTVELKNKSKEISYKESDAKLSDYGINSSEVQIEVKGGSKYGVFWGAIYSFLPVILIILFFYWMTRQAATGNNRALSFGETRARLFGPGKTKVTFADVAGLKEAKQELYEVVEFLKNPMKFTRLGAEMPRGILLTGPAGTGKCIVGKTMILTNKGLIPIQDIPKYFYVDNDNRIYGAKVATLDPEKRKNVVTPVSHWYNLGFQKTLKIKTQFGYEIEGTYEHPIIILDDRGNFIFKRLDQINKGDYVLIRYGTNTFGNLTIVPDEDTAYFLGLLLGDGNLTIKNRIGFSTSDQNILSFVKRYLKRKFNYSLLKSNNRKYDWFISKKEIVNKIIEDYGLLPVYSENKTIPETILGAPQYIVKAFLQGLFDSDGSVDKRGVVEFSSSSQKLLDGVNLLLLNLGIVSKKRTKVKRYNGKLHFILNITGDFLQNFNQLLGFRFAEKKNQLLSSYLKNKVGSNTNVNLIYNQRERIKAIWNYARANGVKVWRDFDHRCYKDINRYLNGTRQPSLYMLQDFLKDFGNRLPRIKNVPDYVFLKSLVFSGFFFSPVSLITKSKNIVYDFTVPHYHSFIANGIVNHNTLLAKAVAGEASVPFFSLSASEFVEMFVGVGSARVRSTFAKAKRNAPAIIFIDELDAIGRVRGPGIGGGHDEREQTLNQILVEMDGFETDARVVVLASTNRPDILDPALLRPGRFDRKIILDLPDIKEREDILKIHTKDKPLSEDADLSKLSKITAGFSGADLRNLANEAAILAARREKKNINQKELEESIEKVILGPERKSHLLSEKEKGITAYHEAGHAIVSWFSPFCDSVHKISIISRGPAAGYTWSLPKEDKKLHSKKEFAENLSAMLAGRAAEEIIFGDITTGAANDLKKATDTAKDMVTRFGMSEKLGPITWGEKEEAIFLGKELAEHKTYSEETASAIDKEVKSIIEAAHKKAKEILDKKKELLKKTAKKLITEETIEGAELEKLFGKRP